MNVFQNAVAFLHEDMYHEFKIALLKGYWRSGEMLTANQRKICEEVVATREAYKFIQPETQPLLADSHPLDDGFSHIVSTMQ